MATIQDLSSAVRATEDWIDDLMGRLGWHDRDRVYLVLLATLPEGPPRDVHPPAPICKNRTAHRGLNPRQHWSFLFENVFAEHCPNAVGHEKTPSISKISLSPRQS